MTGSLQCGIETFCYFERLLWREPIIFIRLERRHHFRKKGTDILRLLLQFLVKIMIAVVQRND